MANDADKDRTTFLIAMYNQMMNDINRHIVVVWQSVSVLFAAFAALALVGQRVIPLDLGISIIVIVCAWVVAHVYDASYWYNRNLVIIANIERQFLRQSDLKEIHYYFGDHRKTGAMITHLENQLRLALAVAALVLAYHFITVVAPTLSFGAPIRWLSTLPWFAGAVLLAVWWHSSEKASSRYTNFLLNSPGKSIDTTGIQHGPGHPV